MIEAISPLTTTYYFILYKFVHLALDEQRLPERHSMSVATSMFVYRPTAMQPLCGKIIIVV